MQNTEWRMMQYAPKDGSSIVVYDYGCDLVATAYWGDGRTAEGMAPDWYWSWHRTDLPVGYSDCSPECWMALPPKPEG